MRLTELASYLGAEIVWPKGGADQELLIKKVAPIEHACSGEISFVANRDYAKFAKTTHASAVIMREHDADCPKPQLIHRNPYMAFARAARLFFRPHRGPTGVADSAFIASDATLGDEVTIYPNVFVGSQAKLGNNVVLFPGVAILEGVSVGDNTIVYPNAVIYHDCVIGSNVVIHSGAIIGADGFGYAVGDGDIVKIPQTGNVVIEDDVEIGACTTIDRAAMGSTLIKRGTKLDSKVQIGHNVEVGEHCMMSALTGIAGSAKLGNWVVMGGHSGVNGHIEVADRVTVGGLSGLTKSVSEPGGTYLGFPAIPASTWRRQQVYLKKLADYEARIKKLEARLADES